MSVQKNKSTTNKEFLQLVKENESAKHIAHINRVFLQNIAEALPQYVFWKDLNSFYQGCNKNYANLVGLNFPEDIIGKTDNDLDWQSLGDTLETFQKGDRYTILGHPITNQEETLALPNGKILIALVSKLPIIDNGIGQYEDKPRFAVVATVSQISSERHTLMSNVYADGYKILQHIQTKKYLSTIFAEGLLINR